MPTWIEISFRTLGMVALIYVVAKLIGKKQVSKLTYAEFLIGSSIGFTAAYFAFRTDVHFVFGVIVILILTSVTVGLEMLSLKSKAIRTVFFGKSTVMIKDGKVMEDNLKSERYTTDHLLHQLRSKQAFNIADVEFALLEPDGELNVLLKSEQQPVTSRALNLNVASSKEPHTVIMDGEIIDEGLATLGYSRAWMYLELEKQGVTIENVFLGQVDSNGQLTLDLFDDQIELPQPTEMPMLLASLKKCQADLELFALSTENEAAKEMYAGHAEHLQNEIDKLTPILNA
jgi:uncharacterized membrane protein YcaP (DUF421 family)